MTGPVPETPSTFIHVGTKEREEILFNPTMKHGESEDNRSRAVRREFRGREKNIINNGIMTALIFWVAATMSFVLAANATNHDGDSSTNGNTCTTISDVDGNNNDNESCIDAAQQPPPQREMMIGEAQKPSGQDDVSTSTAPSNGNSNNNDDNHQSPDDLDETCGIWVAISTLPNSGLGMYAGKSYQPGELLPIRDHATPMFDVRIHHEDEDEYPFLWEDYYWNGGGMTCIDQSGLAPVNDRTYHPSCGHYSYSLWIASCGFGSTANSFMDFVNLEEELQLFITPPSHSTGGDNDGNNDKTDDDNVYGDGNAYDIHRYDDPGAGAFSYFQNRLTRVLTPIQAGDEFFVSYGDNWFNHRAHDLGPIPIEGDHDLAEELYRSVRELPGSKSVLDDLWNSFVLHSPWQGHSRLLEALPKVPFTDEEDAFLFSDDDDEHDDEEEEKIGKLIQLKQRSMKRSVEWLKENGICADHLEVGRSTLPHAGGGAFSRRPLLPKGTIVLPVPLIHIADRDIMDMYPLEFENVETGTGRPHVIDSNDVVSKQLMLNYCLGHAESTLLLSPFGPMFNYINHNQTLANVKLQWADPKKSNHHEEWLNFTVEQLKDQISSTKLGMELVATRDIYEGDEIFLDYGDEWEEAWQEHVTNWERIDEFDGYKTAHQLNIEQYPLLTKSELMSDDDDLSYPGNVNVKFDLSFQNPADWKPLLLKENVTEALWEYKLEKDGKYVRCEITHSWPAPDVGNNNMNENDGDENSDEAVRYYYTALIYPNYNKYPTHSAIVHEAPREAFTFEDARYTSDIFLPNAFRHDIRIPDEIFPTSWKNVVLPS